jgi:hypothetical protein
MAAIGRVLPIVLAKSPAPSFFVGIWYGMTIHESELIHREENLELTEVSPPHILLSRHD